MNFFVESLNLLKKLNLNFLQQKLCYSKKIKFFLFAMKIVRSQNFFILVDLIAATVKSITVELTTARDQSDLSIQLSSPLLPLPRLSLGLSIQTLFFPESGALSPLPPSCAKTISLSILSLSLSKNSYFFFHTNSFEEQSPVIY